MTDPLDRMLDALRVPEPAPGFADRIVARATALPQHQPQPAAPAEPRRLRDRRGAWLRRHRVLGAFIGANLLAAGAVAAALATGVEIRQVPLIAPVIEAIAPAPRAPAPAPAIVARPSPTPAASAPGEEAAAAPLAPGVERALARRDALAAAVRARDAAGLPVPPRVRRRVEMHAKERIAIEMHRRGEPVPIELRTDIVRERLELAPPRLRARVEAEVARRRGAGLPVPPALDAALAPPATLPLPSRDAEAVAAPPGAGEGRAPAPPPPAAPSSPAPSSAAEPPAAAGAADQPAAETAPATAPARPRLDPVRRQQLIEQIRARRAARGGPR